MFSKIIVPVDGSEPSEAAIRLAIGIASEHHGEVVFIHAVELNKIVALAGPASIDVSAAIDAECRAGDEILASAKKAAETAGVAATCELPEDQCVASVLDAARRKKADLIVIGSHGRTGIPRAVLGSVAEGILRRSSIPVLVCHAGWSAPAHGEGISLAAGAM